MLKIARLRIPDLFNFMTEVPAPLVPRSLVFEIPERCSATGKILQPLDEAAVREAVTAARAKGVEICCDLLLAQLSQPGQRESRTRDC